MSTEYIMCRLLAAWVHGAAPEAADIPDFEALFQTASKHLLSAAVCAALEQTGLMKDCPPEIEKRFREAKAKSIRKTILMDAERGKILEMMDEKGIWYAPMKGVIVNAVYPQYGTRQFADNDILFDATRWRDVRDLMKRRGFTVKRERNKTHDAYHKPPIYNFEMHRRLFSDNGISDFLPICAAYYADPRERLIKDEGSRFGYHFSDEDFYVYFLAHAFKHYDERGTGLRTLLDVYLYRRAKPEMDRAYIGGELRKLGLEEFEGIFRSLAEKRFGPVPCPELTEKERDMLAWVEGSGVYGTIAHRVQTGLRKIENGGPVTARTKAKYLFRRVFPPWDWYRDNAPFAYRHRWAVPFVWVYRLCRGVFVKGRQAFGEIRVLCAHHEE